ncbi:MAG: carboxypeptidase regulatory-like domain-containing protein, partial [bacterium]
QEDSIMIVGNVLIENINQEFAFDNWGMSAQVVIVGKSYDGALRRYTASTDNKGYYCLPNIPAGQYAIKAVILLEPGAKPIKLVNDLTTPDSKFYRMRHPERPIEYTAEWLPSKATSRIISLDIIWLGLRAAYISDLSSKSVGETLVVKSLGDLQNKRFYDKGYPYTREAPLTYFKKKFPYSDWWKL